MISPQAELRNKATPYAICRVMGHLSERFKAGKNTVICTPYAIALDYFCRILG